jgi:hypothetical protein
MKMTTKTTKTTTTTAWLATAAIALMVTLAAVRCSADVELGVDPGTDAATARDDGGVEGG